ncbi:MAG: DUF1223 domain-containing protein [Bacteroidota bacterium]
MKTRVAATIILISFASFLFLNFDRLPPFKSEPVAIAELFTSEGCSSCPPADELLHEMTDIAKNEGKTLLGLAFHITYWNHLGWVDPYSSEAYTVRQKNYVKVLQAPQLYTPQMIVNGEFELVGSNPIAFREALNKTWKKAPAYLIEASAELLDDTVAVKYTLNKKPGNVVLNIAVVENQAERKITRGENKSRTLRHHNVVRAFKTIEPKIQGEIKLTLPEDLRPGGGSIILYVQYEKTLRILGASKISLQ